MARKYRTGKKRKSTRRRRVGVAVGTRRRRRVGAMSLSVKSPLVIYGSIAAGFLLGDKINDLIDKPIGDKVDGKILAAGQAGLGAAYIFMMKGKKSLPLTVVAGLALGSGLKRGMTEFGIGSIGPYGNNPVIAGPYGNVKVVSGKRMNGYNPHGSLGRGYSPNSSLNGGRTNVVGSVLHDGENC